MYEYVEVSQSESSSKRKLIVKRAIVSLNNLQEDCVQFDWYNDVNQPLCDCDGDLQSEFTLISWC